MGRVHPGLQQTTLSGIPRSAGRIDQLGCQLSRAFFKGWAAGFWLGRQQFARDSGRHKAQLKIESWEQRHVCPTVGLATSLYSGTTYLRRTEHVTLAGNWVMYDAVALLRPKFVPWGRILVVSKNTCRIKGNEHNCHGIMRGGPFGREQVWAEAFGPAVN